MKELDELKEGINSLNNSSQKILEKLGQIQSPSEKWLDVTEACRYLKISTRTLQNYRNKGMLPYSQIGAKIYFRFSDLNNFIESHMINN